MNFICGKFKSIHPAAYCLVCISLQKNTYNQSHLIVWKPRRALTILQPNLQPPITTVEQALEYQKKLESLASNVTFLMTLYLHQSITPATIREAKEAGIVGVKSYPQGVTTNSDGGVFDYASYYPVFAEMEKLDMVLNLHGECPSTPRTTASAASLPGPPPGDDPWTRANREKSITILTAEEAFLPTLLDLHSRFPRLRIVLEHCTTAAAIEVVRLCGPTVGATITAHHLFLTVEDWAGDPFCYCKPVAKTPADRRALLEAVVSRDPKFFFGSDSAPHSVSAKQVLVTVGDDDAAAHSGGGKNEGPRNTSAGAKKKKALKSRKPAAGIYTQKYCTQYVIDALQIAVKEGIVREDRVTQEMLEGFLSEFGRTFYRVDEILQKRAERSKDSKDNTAESRRPEVIVITTGAARSKSTGEEDEDEGEDEEIIENILRSNNHNEGAEQGEGEEIEVVIFRGGERICRLRWDS